MRQRIFSAADQQSIACAGLPKFLPCAPSRAPRGNKAAAPAENSPEAVLKGEDFKESSMIVRSSFIPPPPNLLRPRVDPTLARTNVAATALDTFESSPL